MLIHSTIDSLLKNTFNFWDDIAPVYVFLHHIAETIFKAQEQYVSIALVFFCGWYQIPPLAASVSKRRKFDIILCKMQSRFTRELELVE